MGATILKVLGMVIALLLGLYLGTGRYKGTPEEIEEALGKPGTRKRVKRHFTPLDLLRGKRRVGRGRKAFDLKRPERRAGR